MTFINRVRRVANAALGHIKSLPKTPEGRLGLGAAATALTASVGADAYARSTTQPRET
jgi:hypothetical protein